jgi:hypothetical protein
VSGDGPRGAEYRTARQASAVLLIVAAVIVILLGTVEGFRQADPLIVTAMFATAAGLLAVDIPAFRR